MGLTQYSRANPRTFLQRFPSITPQLICSSRAVFPKFLLSDPFWFRKITTDPYILSHVNIDSPDERCPELDTYILELTLDGYEHIALIYVIMQTGLELNADKTKYMVMSRDQNAGRIHSVRMDNSTFESVEEFKIFGNKSKFYCGRN